MYEQTIQLRRRISTTRSLQDARADAAARYKICQCYIRLGAKKRALRELVLTMQWYIVPDNLYWAISRNTWRHNETRTRHIQKVTIPKKFRNLAACLCQGRLNREMGCMQQAKMAYRDALKHNPFALEALVELQRVAGLLMIYAMLVCFAVVRLRE